MLRYRLTLGPVLILLAFAMAWVDGWLDGVATPGWLSGLNDRETLPPGIVIFVMSVVLSVMASRELTVILRSKGVPSSARMNSLLSCAGLCLAALIPVVWRGTTAAGAINAAVGGVMLVSLIVYSRHHKVEGMIAAAGGSLLAFTYLGMLFAFMVMIRREHEIWVLVWVVLVTKSCDIGAFFTGTAIGKHKLIPWVSPGKTWEGLIGGMVFAGVIAIVGSVILAEVVDGWAVPWVWAGVSGVVFGGVGQLGDLMASMLKRDAGVKDAGRSLPGFGGVIDVIDSLVLVGPVAFWMLRGLPGLGS